ncbi:hypothetical protein G6011_06938 [Alternaria panax]|uniref:Uncharacterized protein n=1 Tax=Alternaria panax TaxID=48097 RepID=A0AAD4I524_9PLEO|nr:hypothetical protein G6011_06938 [Alternaria panax]
MTIATNPPVQKTFILSPTPTKTTKTTTTTTFHINPRTLPQSANPQTFLLSPTPSPSPTRTRGDSPVLPSTPTCPSASPFPPTSPIHALFHDNSHVSTPTSTLPAYRTPRSFYNERLPSNDPLFAVCSSASSDLSTARTAVERSLKPQNSAQLSEILPGDVEFYAGEDGDGYGYGYGEEEEEEEQEQEQEQEEARRSSIKLTDSLLNLAVEPEPEPEPEPDKCIKQQTGKSARIDPVPVPTRQGNANEDSILETDIRCALPVIQDGDFSYYPDMSPQPPRQTEREAGNEEPGRRRLVPCRRLVKKNRGDGSGSGVRVLLHRMLRRVKKMKEKKEKKK